MMLEILTTDELLQSTTISISEFLEQIDIHCCGCLSAMKDHIANDRKGQYVTINKHICLNQEYQNHQTIGKTIQKLISQSEAADSIIMNIFKKNSQTNKKRCQLHARKPLPDIAIQDNIQEICNIMSEKCDNFIIHESEFSNHLGNYLKTKKFCPSCKDNILNAYTFLKQQQPQPECSCSIICFIKYNHEAKEILVPYDAILLNALLNKAQIQPFYQHASTKEDAQDELIICLGILLKERLINFWRERQNNEFVNYLFHSKLGEVFEKRLEHQINLKMESLGHQNELDRYLQKKDEQKIKQKKKRQMRKQKKKEQLSSDGSSRTNHRLEESQRSTSTSNSLTTLFKVIGYENSPSVSPATRQELEHLQKQHLEDIQNRRRQLREQTKQCWCEWCNHQKQ